MAQHQGDLFGPQPRAPRGWTELDKLRRRYGILTDKVMGGEASTKEMEEAHKLAREIVIREEEAMGKWKKSFET
jgi:hypothetical protein